MSESFTDRPGASFGALVRSGLLMTVTWKYRGQAYSEYVDPDRVSDPKLMKEMGETVARVFKL